jgi:SAM-dependent methyltransferase
MMKVCDAADWFAGGLGGTITTELHEVPRFHRKQWEFAAKFNALQASGALHAGARGISFGSGQELLIYALANHVRRIWATDIYNDQTIWPDARTSDIDAFVRGNPPFPTQVDRISAKNMDMRQIEFEDESFDFAYSSSAVEHIGGWDDFRRHLSEVRRVLKPGGVYVLTTDISYGKATEAPGNFKFDRNGLEWWLAESGMSYEPVIDCRIAKHYANMPLPADPMTYIAPDNGSMRSNLFQLLLQVQMLTGRYPHSSVLLVMRKGPAERSPVRFCGLQETTEFLENALQTLQTSLEESDLSLNPAPYVPVDLRGTMWASTYAWLGDRLRTVRVRITTDRPGHVTVGVNKAHTDTYWMPMVEVPPRVEFSHGKLEAEILLACQRDWTYAIYGNALDDVRLVEVELLVRDARSTSQVRILPPPVPAKPDDAPAASQPLLQPATPVVPPPSFGRALNRLLLPIGIQLVRPATPIRDGANN